MQKLFVSGAVGNIATQDAMGVPVHHGRNIRAPEIVGADLLDQGWALASTNQWALNGGCDGSGWKMKLG